MKVFVMRHLFHITAESPIILNPPEVRKYVAESQDIELQCKVFGSPVPRIVWQKANEQLTGGRFQVMSESGNLRITVRKRYDISMSVTITK